MSHLSMPRISHRLAASILSLALPWCVADAWAQTTPNAATPAPAPAVPAAVEASPLSFNIGLSTDYRYRSISQSRLSPALQGGVDYAHASGLYVGAWGSTIGWIKDGGGRAPVEVDVYAGYKGNLGANKDFSFDVGGLQYLYPNHQLAVSPNTFELYGALGWKVVTLKYSHSLTNLFGVAGSAGSGYWDLSANFDLGDGWSLTPHIGRQVVRGNSALSYTDVALTLGKDFGHGWSASAAVLATNANASLYTSGTHFTGRTGVALGIKKTF